MKKLKMFCAAALCAVLVAPCLHPGAALVDNGSGGGRTIARGRYVYRDGSYSEAEEEEYNRIETTVITSTTDREDISTSTITKDVIEPADIVFVIDSTGSMSPYIKNVKDNVEKFAEYLLMEKKVGARMAVMEYRDITCDGEDSTKIHMVDGTTWHKTTDELKKTLEIVRSNVRGGGDEPETVVDALGFVANGSLLFREDAHKFAILLTDASYKEDNRHGLSMDSLIASLDKQNIHTSVITGTWLFDKYKGLTGKTGITADISSKNFSEELNKIADEMCKTIEEEVIDKTITPVESVKVTSKGDSAIKVGNSITLNALILPETAEKKTVTWVVADEGIVSLSVSEDTRSCKVTGVKKGETSIVAASEDGGFTGEYKVKVIGSTSSGIGRGDGDENEAMRLTIDDITVSPAKKTLAKGQKLQIKVSAKLDDGDISKEELDELVETCIDSISYRSTKTSVASVNAKTGTVTARSKGNATIKTTIKMADGGSKTFKTVIYVK